MRINKQWHEQNRMPKTPSLETRINWHLEHARECSCRPVPEKLLVEMRKRHLIINVEIVT